MIEKFDSKQLSLATTSILGQPPSLIETLNGEAISDELTSNRAFLYGDGVFTTAKLENNKVVDLQRHWQRLVSDSKALEIKPPNFESLNDCLNKIIQQWQSSQGIVRITVFRSGGRGYRGSQNALGELHIAIHPFTALSSNIKLQTVTTQLSRNATLAGIKHINRLQQVLIASELDDAFYEAVVLDTENFVIEGMMSNLFWFDDGMFYTPNLELSGVNGLARRKLIEGLQNRNRQLKIDFFYLEHLMRAKFVWICNAVHGVTEVNSINHKTFSINEEKTRLLNSIFKE